MESINTYYLDELSQEHGKEKLSIVTDLFNKHHDHIKWLKDNTRKFNEELVEKLDAEFIKIKDEKEHVIYQIKSKIEELNQEYCKVLIYLIEYEINTFILI